MKEKHYKKWTNEEDLVIISMRNQSKTLKEIANTLGRTTGATGVRCSKLIGECKLKKKSGGIPSKLDYQKIAEHVSRNPNNLAEAFRNCAKELHYSTHAIRNAYYSKKHNKNKVRVKDSGTLFTIVSNCGHTINNTKNGGSLKTSNLWDRLKDWLLHSLLS